MNWLSIAPAQPFIVEELGITVTSLGLLGAVFLIGIGSFQIPAGLLAAKYNPKKIAIIGLALSSLFAGLCGLATSFPALLLFRFLAGVFMSFFFGPGIAFFTPFFNVRERGVALGIYNAGFHVGTLIALGAWPYLITSAGWRLGLLVPGMLGILLAAITYSIARGFPVNKNSEGINLTVLRNRDVWLAAFGLTVAGGAWYPLTQFGILYITSQTNLSLETAGMLVSLLSVGSIIGAPVSGRVYDTVSSRRGLFLVVSGGISVGLVALATPSIHIVVAAMLALGFLTTSAHTIYYLLPMGRVSETQISLAVALINGVHLLGASALPYFFAVCVELFGYGFAWVGVAFVSLISLLVVFRLRFN
ncbi:MAG: MFS transporter [Candidatus Caldarchaeum sp.]